MFGLNRAEVIGRLGADVAINRMVSAGNYRRYTSISLSFAGNVQGNSYPTARKKKID